MKSTDQGLMLALVSIAFGISCGGGASAPRIDAFGDRAGVDGIDAVADAEGEPIDVDLKELAVDATSDADATVDLGLDSTSTDIPQDNAMMPPDGYTVLEVLEAYSGDPNPVLFDGIDLGIDPGTDPGPPSSCTSDGQCSDGLF